MGSLASIVAAIADPALRSLGHRPSVRGIERWDQEVFDGHLPRAVTVELGALAGDTLPAELPEGPITVMCGHGERAMTAASLLARAGRNDLRVALGGPKEWERATGQALARS